MWICMWKCWVQFCFSISLILVFRVHSNNQHFENECNYWEWKHISTQHHVNDSCGMLQLKWLLTNMEWSVYNRRTVEQSKELATNTTTNADIMLEATIQLISIFFTTPSSLSHKHTQSFTTYFLTTKIMYVQNDVHEPTRMILSNRYTFGSLWNPTAIEKHNNEWNG